MNLPPEVTRPEPSEESPAKIHGTGMAMRKFQIGALLLIAAFALPLYDLVRFALQSELYSHVILVPVVSLYLGWTRRAELSAGSAPHRGLAALFLLLGLAAAAAFGAVRLADAPVAQEDSLALSTSAFVLLLAGIGGLFLGRQTLRELAFPLGFLVFMVPMPTSVVEEIEALLQHGSAYVAGAMFKLYGTPVFRQELVFQLEGIRLEIAPECSGIHSSLALLITSVIAGVFFLRSSTSRVVLALAVIPLALLRNGFRVFVIGELCVHVGPHMIDSYIHRHGGPIFFALSLIPFFALLFALVRFERRRAPKVAHP